MLQVSVHRSGMKKNRHKENNQTSLRTHGVIRRHAAAQSSNDCWISASNLLQCTFCTLDRMSKGETAPIALQGACNSLNVPKNQTDFHKEKTKLRNPEVRTLQGTNEYYSAPLSRTNATNFGAEYVNSSNKSTDLVWRETVTESNRTSLLTHDGMPSLNQAATVESAPVTFYNAF